jgi:peptidyl-prolyl cis-trans isomerase C
MKISEFKEKIKNINFLELKKFSKNLKLVGFVVFGFILGAITTIEYPSLLGNNLIVDLKSTLDHKKDDKILAKGEGIKVYESELKAKLKTLKTGVDIDVNKIPLEAKKILVNEIAGQKAIFNKAIKEKIQNDEYIKEELGAYAKNLIKAKYLEEFIKESVTEENVKSVYNQLKNELNGKYEIKASHILLGTEEEANKVFARVRYNKKRFSTLAQQESLDKSTAKNGGNLGYIVQGRMLKEFEDKAFSGNKNEILKPFQTKLGWHVVYVEDKREAQAATFEQARRNIENELAKNAIKGHVLKLLEDLNFVLVEK